MISRKYFLHIIPRFQNLILLLLCFTLGAGLFSCEKQEVYDTETGLHPAVQRTIDERVSRYRNRLLKNCRRKVLVEATERVDSIIIANAKRIKAIPVDRPPKPIRPREDSSAPDYDTTKVEPLWDLDSLLYEQLLRRHEFVDSLMILDSLLLDSLRTDSLLIDSLGTIEKN